MITFKVLETFFKMDFFEQNKALIITVLLFLLVLLAMYNISLSSSNKELQGTLIELETIKEEESAIPEEEQQQEPEEKNTPQPQSPPMQTHQAFNENQAEKQENFRSRLNEIFEKNSAKKELSEESSSSTSGDFNTGVNNDDKPEEQSDGEGTTDEISTKTGSLRNSSISFSLLGRQAIEIPNPIYTCETGGKIVINITVNEQGLVEETSYNEASSTSTNECLIEHALQYAAEARFSQLLGRNSQIGTITYYFQEQ